MDFALLPEYFGGSFDMEYAKKLVIEAFEEDTGLKVGSGVAESGEEEEDEDHQARSRPAENKSATGMPMTMPDAVAPVLSGDALGMPQLRHPGVEILVGREGYYRGTYAT
ncbi:hypothetical protein THAOC_08296 [Thalassiosira oceanica]|uniref:Uncharacterized protein n=1 Tax=Thalassiosira oceanica TaxID=159749 RepID=K0SVC7_THAOC|nr:hypothetical protein THAOC_08296 [Thalassiosira oceanica]|eukprot:EJK70353.1 hypothetical protein THAOC_08296 [Thalassiosira oceanica]